jgi:acyl transferase domain-containing protein/acyl carrier protein
MTETEYSPTGLEIAVIGMSGRFPGADNIDEFWENLKNGVNAITYFSDEELEEAGIPPERLKLPNYVKARGIVKDVEYFDALFFGFKSPEAERLDPQIRLFYQCVWHALEHAGYPVGRYRGLIGLYAGATPNFGWEAVVNFGSKIDAVEYFASSHLMDKDYLCTGISYRLNLKGPSFSLHTACSTSLVAIHVACQALLSGECDIALAGGVSVTTPPKGGYLYHEGLIVSPDGYCRVFDHKAAGTVFGCGAGVVVLKSLEDAAADGDTVHAVIKGSAINNDGSRKVGFTAPSAKGQAEVIRAAYNSAGVNPETVGYVEAHGTGTAIGDPIEIEALTLAFDTESKQFCRIGSVKSNVGHLDCAAGAAGFIKAVLTLKHKLIPPTLHVETPNPKIDFQDSPFYLNTELSRWENGKFPLRAAVSSFGVGGTNAHVILEEAPASAGDAARPPCYLIPLSAKTASALERMTRNLVEHLTKNPGMNLADAAYTLAVGREPFPHRRVLVCSGIEDALESLSQPGSPRVQTFYSPKGEPPLFFMFPGQGSPYVDMGRGLYEGDSHFRREMDDCFTLLGGLVECDIKEILYPAYPGSTAAETINGAEIVRPLICAFEYVLGKLLIRWGLKPEAMICRGTGEYAAACLSGVFGLEDALALAVLRGRSRQRTAPDREPLQQEFRRIMGTVKLHKPEIPYISAVTGKRVTAEQVTDPRYWESHLGQEAGPGEGLRELLKEADALFVELGPGRGLAGAAAGHKIVNLLRPPGEDPPDFRYVLTGLGQLWVTGKDLNWQEFYSDGKRLRIPLPTYPFESQRYGKYIDAYAGIKNSRLPTAGEERVEESAAAGEMERRQPRPHLPTPYVEPDTPLERKLADIYRDFFGIDKVGINDNFFDLGASSLDLTQLSRKFSEAVGREIPVVNLFRYPMIRLLAESLDGQDRPVDTPGEAGEQKRLAEVLKGRQGMQERLRLIKEEKS